MIKKKKINGLPADLMSDGPPSLPKKQKVENPENLKPLHPFGEDYQKAELAKSQAEMDKIAMEKRKSREILSRGMRRPRPSKNFLNLRTTLGAKE